MGDPDSSSEKIAATENKDSGFLRKAGPTETGSKEPEKSKSKFVLDRNEAVDNKKELSENLKKSNNDEKSLILAGKDDDSLRDREESKKKNSKTKKAKKSDSNSESSPNKRKFTRSRSRSRSLSPANAKPVQFKENTYLEPFPPSPGLITFEDSNRQRSSYSDRLNNEIHLSYEDEQQEKMRDFLKNIQDMEDDQNPDSEDNFLEQKLREFEAQLGENKKNESEFKTYKFDQAEERPHGGEETKADVFGALSGQKEPLSLKKFDSYDRTEEEESIPFFQKQIQNSLLSFNSGATANQFDYNNYKPSPNSPRDLENFPISSHNASQSLQKRPNEPGDGDPALGFEEQQASFSSNVKIKILNPNDLNNQFQNSAEANQLLGNQNLYGNLGLFQGYGLNPLSSQAFIAQNNLMGANHPLLNFMQGQVNSPAMLSSYNNISVSSVINPLIWQQAASLLGNGSTVPGASAMGAQVGSTSPILQSANNEDLVANPSLDNNELNSLDADTNDPSSQRGFMLNPAQLTAQQQMFIQQQGQNSLLANKALFEQASALKKSNPESSVFVKNISPNITVKELEAAFSIYGKLLSCKIAVDLYGQSLGYAYLTYETKESAEDCIQNANNALLKDTVIQVQPFVSKINRIDARNNLYVKNLPTYMSEDQLNQKLMEIFGRFGPITSSVVKLDKTLKKPFAFICFENHIYADLAFKALHDTDPFKFGSRLYISWAEKKVDRVKRLAELHSVQQGVVGNPLSYQMGSGDSGLGGNNFSVPSYMGDYSSQGGYYMSK